jgi:hypothetical protein
MLRYCGICLCAHARAGANAAIAAAEPQTPSPQTPPTPLLLTRRFCCRCRRCYCCRWLEVEAWRRPEVADIADIMLAVDSCCKVLSALVKRAQTDDLAGMYNPDEGGATNIQVCV